VKNLSILDIFKIYFEELSSRKLKSFRRIDLLYFPMVNEKYFKIKTHIMKLFSNMKFLYISLT